MDMLDESCIQESTDTLADSRDDALIESELDAWQYSLIVTVPPRRDNERKDTDEQIVSVSVSDISWFELPPTRPLPSNESELPSLCMLTNARTDREDEKLAY
jgi:hypothetical protein